MLSKLSQPPFRRWVLLYCAASVILLLLALLNEGLNVGGAWRWGRFDDDPNALSAIRMTFYSEAIAYYGPGLANHMKSLAVFGGLLMVLAIAWWTLRGRFAAWRLPIVGGLLLLSNLPAIQSARHLNDSHFEWKHGLRYGTYHKYFNNLIAFSEDGKIGFKDSNGKVAIPPRFDCVGDIGVIDTPAGIVVGIAGKQTLVDFKGGEFFPAIYDELSSLRLDQDWIRAKYQGKWGFIDYRGKVKLPFQYEQLGEMGSMVVNKPLAAFRSGGKWGYMDQDGKEVLRPLWEDAYGFVFGVAVVKRNGKSCYINEAGIEVVPCEFDSVLAISDRKSRLVPDLFWVTQNEKTGLYDSRSKRIVVPVEYDSWIVSSEVKRVPEGYSLTPSKADHQQKDGSAVVVARGEKPDIPWARFNEAKKKESFSRSPMDGSPRPRACVSTSEH